MDQPLLSFTLGGRKKEILAKTLYMSWALGKILLHIWVAIHKSCTRLFPQLQFAKLQHFLINLPIFQFCKTTTTRSIHQFTCYAAQYLFHFAFLLMIFMALFSFTFRHRLSIQIQIYALIHFLAVGASLSERPTKEKFTADMREITSLP